VERLVPAPVQTGRTPPERAAVVLACLDQMPDGSHVDRAKNVGAKWQATQCHRYALSM
jgi:hypothetical protein